MKGSGAIVKPNAKTKLDVAVARGVELFIALRFFWHFVSINGALNPPSVHDIYVLTEEENMAVVH